MAKHGQPYQRPTHTGHLKPKGYEDWFTLSEVSFAVERGPKHIVQCEKAGTIPQAKRIPFDGGVAGIRLWSPAQVAEMRMIFAARRPGRKRRT